MGFFPKEGSFKRGSFKFILTLTKIQVHRSCEIRLIFTRFYRLRVPNIKLFYPSQKIWQAIICNIFKEYFSQTSATIAKYFKGNIFQEQFLFNVNNGNTRTMCEIFKSNNRDIRMT